MPAEPFEKLLDHDPRTLIGFARIAEDRDDDEEYFGKHTAGYDQFDPDYEVVLFEAMKTAVEIANDHRHPVNDDLRRQALERAAEIADCWRCEVTYDAETHAQELVERQNKVACRIAAAIRAEAEMER